MPRRIMITGSDGFVGKHLVGHLLQRGFEISATTRSATTDQFAYDHFALGNIDGSTDWRAALKDCDTVVHLAGETSANHSILDTVNNLATKRLVHQSVDAGVSTFIFLSSLAVLDQSTSPLTDSTPTAPRTAYGLSKLNAECHVADFKKSGGASIILRSPLIYGAGAKGKWKHLTRLALSPIPLPIGSLDYRRTLLSIGNLISAVERILVLGPSSPSGAYVVGDDEPLALTDIVRIIRTASGRPLRIVRVPPSILKSPFAALGKQRAFNRLLGTLEVNSQRFRDDFGWMPAETAENAIKHCVAH